MVVQSWADVLVSSFQTIWSGFIGFLPKLLGAIIVFLVGLIIANGLGALVAQLINAIKLDKFLEKVGLGKFFERAGWKLNSGKFFEEIVKWFFIIVFLLAAADILQLYGLTSFLHDVLLYIPNVIIAVLIMLAAVILGNFLRGLVLGGTKGAKLYPSKALASITWWVVLIFGFFAALLQLGVATSIVNAVITGTIAMLAVAGGIAFGLGGKEYAAHLIAKFRDRVEEK
ncbi:MAG TPA: hypothetical protein PKZ02_00695 [Candidatus Paceibacterota bacterium]|nr:hypothetical protein [Candidatus Paceibacterota bacterium]